MNRVYIEPTKFTDLRSGEATFGWRAFDDYSQAYDNTWSEKDMPKDDLDFLKRVLEVSDDETLWGMLEFCEENEQGIHIGDRFIEWQEFSPLLKSVHAS
ncbi:MAG TPA: hypothetical protein VFC17_13245 [Candidatus Limnocylindrales bacterium]|nr:hypothetical protein [Candidatus Limnocylindrales bacterium]